MSTRYPVFIPTKGRAQSPLTIRAFDALGVDYRIVVEAQEVDAYAAVVAPERILVLPFAGRGLVAARNWIWDYAQGLGVSRFWTFDDNIKAFYRLNHNLKVPVRTTATFRAIEDFADRYDNVAIAGMHYFMFASRKSKLPPVEFNTRVYSNMLIQTDLLERDGRPFRNRGFFNDDTDLCLRVLKDGWCTVLFLAFLAEKSVTMSVPGGMTPHYQGDGRLKMAQELQGYHPDVTKITWKWGRWQHSVDYRPFKHNRLRLKPGVRVPEGVNEYGMQLVRRRPDESSPTGHPRSPADGGSLQS